MASVNNTDGIFIIFMGENHGWNDDPKVLLGQQKAILEMQTSCQGKYLIVGLSTGNSETREKIDHAMEVVHKDKFVNVREYLSSDGPSDAGIVPSVDDLNRMQDGEIPECLRADSLDLFDMVMEFEDEFGIEISSEDLEKLSSVGDVIEFIQSKQA